MTTRTRFAPDRGLTARMVLTIFLLGLVYVLFVAALVALVKSVVLIVLIVAGLLVAQFWFADRIALRAMGAVVAGPEEQPYLHGIVDRLCATADLPTPRIAIADMELPNAFATGRSTGRAVLCVTTGLVRRLDPPELEGVLAHELSHIAHRDVVVMTVAAFLGVLAGIVARFSFYSALLGGRGRRSGDQTVVLVLAVMAVSAVVYAISFLLVRALSRYRELAADRSGAMLTGQPSALAAALTKVSGQIARVPTRDLRAAEPCNALFFAPVTGVSVSLTNLMSTHPTLQRRLDQLAELSTELGEAAP